MSSGLLSPKLNLSKVPSGGGRMHGRQWLRGGRGENKSRSWEDRGGPILLRAGTIWILPRTEPEGLAKFGELQVLLGAEADSRGCLRRCNSSYRPLWVGLPGCGGVWRGSCRPKRRKSSEQRDGSCTRTLLPSPENTLINVLAYTAPDAAHTYTRHPGCQPTCRTQFCISVTTGWRPSILTFDRPACLSPVRRPTCSSRPLSQRLSTPKCPDQPRCLG